MKYIGEKESIFIAKKMRYELIYNMAKSEGSTLSFEEISSVVKGTSIGGKRMEELHQIEQIRDGWDEIIQQCIDKKFKVDKENFILLNSIVTDIENPELGNFRTKSISICGIEWQQHLLVLLNERFENMMDEFKSNTDISSKSIGLFLESARNRFFADGNKKTGQLIANGFLISNGYSLFSINETEDLEYKKNLVEFYKSGNKEEIFDFFEKRQAQKNININENLLSTIA